MTTPPPRLSPLEVREGTACMCDRGGACSSYAPGHALHLIQARMAASTPLSWLDAVVEDADPVSGVLHLRTLDGHLIPVWNAGGAALEASIGAPVALHTAYDVLDVAGARYSVVR